MASLAENIVVPIRPDLQAVERRVAELEDGYAKLSNMLLEEYSGADLTKRQYKVLLAILRLTYGWNKAMDRISDSQIAKIAKLPVKRCNETKLELVGMNIIKRDGMRFGPNKYVNEWVIPQNEGLSLKTGDKKSLKLGGGNPSKQGDTKDIIPKKEIQKDITPIVPKPKKAGLDPLAVDLPDWLPVDVWHSWVQYRKEINHAIKSKQTITQAINTLSRCREMGYSPSEIINRSIGNGWQGLFEPKQPNRAATARPTENFASKDYGSTDSPSWVEG